MNDLQILKGIQQEKKETAAQSFIPYWNFSMIDDEEARDNFLKDVCTFLRKFSRIPFGLTPKVILIAWEYVRNISEELSEYINCPSWNRPIFYDNDDDEYTIIYSKPKAITPDLPIEEPDNSLNPSTFDALNDHSEILSDPNDDGTQVLTMILRDVEYVRLEEILNRMPLTKAKVLHIPQKDKIHKIVSMDKKIPERYSRCLSNELAIEGLMMCPGQWAAATCLLVIGEGLGTNLGFIEERGVDFTKLGCVEIWAGKSVLEVSLLREKRGSV
ncbi:hypothetical protein Tco_1016359 [Tanacetum coccineum]|uniref:Uncharacterized protein n=1 Tax=Tanacetum coccineum TaxID=301880 RepID=A0ABQ5FPG1_9ASTR